MSAPRSMTGRKQRYVTAAAYLGIAALSSVLFALAAKYRGASGTDTYLGIVWVFALSAIVSASLLPPLLGKKLGRATS